MTTQTATGGCTSRASHADGDAALAAAHLARHLARTALTVLTHHAPEHDPTTVRAAIRLATGTETQASNAVIKARASRSIR
jgi:hypothetical protein